MRRESSASHTGLVCPLVGLRLGSGFEESSDRAVEVVVQSAQRGEWHIKQPVFSALLDERNFALRTVSAHHHEKTAPVYDTNDLTE